MSQDKSHIYASAQGVQGVMAMRVKTPPSASTISWFSGPSDNGRPGNIEEVLTALLVCYDANEWFHDQVALRVFLMSLQAGNQTGATADRMIRYLYDVGCIRAGANDAPRCDEKRMRQFLERLRRVPK